MLIPSEKYKGVVQSEITGEYMGYIMMGYKRLYVTSDLEEIDAAKNRDIYIIKFKKSDERNFPDNTIEEIEAME